MFVRVHETQLLVMSDAPIEDVASWVYTDGHTVSVGVPMPGATDVVLVKHPDPKDLPQGMVEEAVERFGRQFFKTVAKQVQ